MRDTVYLLKVSLTTEGVECNTAHYAYSKSEWVVRNYTSMLKRRYELMCKTAVMTVTEYASVGQMWRDGIMVSGDDKICTFEVKSEISPYKGKSVVTTCNDIYNSDGGGFISYAEKFLIPQDLYNLFDATDFFNSPAIDSILKNKQSADLLGIATVWMLNYVSREVNLTAGKGPFAFNLDKWDIVHYGIWKGWYNTV